MATQTTSDLLKELMGETDSRVATLDRTREDVPSDLGALQEEMAATDQRTQEMVGRRGERIDIAEQVRNTKTLKQLRERADQEKGDLGKAMFGLNTIIEQLWREFEGRLTNKTTEEEKRIKTAEKAVEEAKTAVTEAESPRWYSFGKEKTLQRAKDIMRQAELVLKRVQQEVAEAARQRLQSADLEDNFQTLLLISQKVTEMMDNRGKNIVGQLQVIAQTKIKLFSDKQDAAKVFTSLNEQLADLEAKLRDEESITLETGTEAQVVQEKLVSDLRTQVEDVRGRRNVALALLQSKTKFAEAIEVYEQTKIKLRDNHRTISALIKSDTEVRIKTFRVRLESMKEASDQDIAKHYDDVASEADQRSVEYMAALGITSDRITMDILGKYPERIEAIRKARSAQAEKTQEIREEMAEHIKQWKEKWGFDPLASSFFSYENEEVTAPSDGER